MPEGDTVYLTARRLDAALAGHRLRRAELRHPRWVEHDLAGLRVLTVRSVGKHLFTRFDNQLSLHSHLRMDGSWHLYRTGQPWRAPADRARVVLHTDERVAVGFRLHDLELLATDQETRLVGHLGPDLLDPEWSSTQAEEAVRRLTADPAAQIGLALLDQRTMAGLGNLYKTEVCFLLGVSPWTAVAELADPNRAVTLGHTLLTRNANRPEQSTTGELGRGRQHWVYQRAGQPCRRCGSRIRTGPQGDGIYARTAFYCPRCQPGPTPDTGRRPDAQP
ncbi:MAG TPA: DNA-formamidopyrimidine glycosylase family protein [Pseudonocardia sp.]|jgi:endonuclease-8